jgi:hypothetical protein
MLRVLAAWLNGDRQVCSMVHVPSPEEEDAKRPHREREHLVQERLRIENRIEALLFTQGIRGRPSLRSWERDMAELRTGDGRKLPPLLRAELDRLRRRLVLTLELIREMETERSEALTATPSEATTGRSRPCSGSVALDQTLPPYWCARCSTDRLPTADNLPATSALHRCLTKAAAWTAIEASVVRGIREPAQRSFSLPGCGCATSPTARSRYGSANVSAHCRGAPGGLKLPRFRGVFDGFVNYGSVVTTSIIASYAIGER